MITTNDGTYLLKEAPTFIVPTGIMPQWEPQFNVSCWGLGIERLLAWLIIGSDI